MIFLLCKRYIYNLNFPVYIGYSYKKYNFYRNKKINSSVLLLLNNRKMKLPKNYKTQYETRDFKRPLD